MLRTAGSYLGDIAAANARTPMGHPEGYLEAFANLYSAFAGQIRAREAGRDLESRLSLRQLLDLCQQSSEDSASWIELC